MKNKKGKLGDGKDKLGWKRKKGETRKRKKTGIEKCKKEN